MTPGMPLPLRDVHLGLAPSWWPPAPGWWMLAGGLLLVLAGLGIWYWRRQQRLCRWAQIFDARLAQAAPGPDQVAAISELLRRAARRIDPAADRLQGADWLRLLDADGKSPAFAAGPGALLAEGLYRREVDAAALEALRVLARRRFLQWMQRA